MGAVVVSSEAEVTCLAMRKEVKHMDGLLVVAGSVAVLVGLGALLAAA